MTLHYFNIWLSIFVGQLVVSSQGCFDLLAPVDLDSDVGVCLALSDFPAACARLPTVSPHFPVVTRVEQMIYFPMGEFIAQRGEKRDGHMPSFSKLEISGLQVVPPKQPSVYTNKTSWNYATVFWKPWGSRMGGSRAGMYFQSFCHCCSTVRLLRINWSDLGHFCAFKMPYRCDFYWLHPIKISSWFLRITLPRVLMGQAGFGFSHCWPCTSSAY